MVFCSELTGSREVWGFDYQVQVRERQKDAMRWGLFTLFVPAVKVTHTGDICFFYAPYARISGPLGPLSQASPHPPTLIPLIYKKAHA